MSSNSKPFINPYPQNNGATYPAVGSAESAAIENKNKTRIIVTFKTLSPDCTLMTYANDLVANTNQSTLRITNAGDLYFYHYYGGTKLEMRLVSLSADYFTDNKPHEIELIVDAANNRFIVDGNTYEDGDVSFDTGTKTDTLFLFPNVTSFAIGVSKRWAITEYILQRYLTGLISEFTIYDENLIDVLFSYKAGYNGIESTSHLVELVQENSLKIGYKQNIFDLSDEQKTVTANEVESYDVDFYGRAKSALIYNGTTQYLTADAVDSNEITLISWFNSDSIANEQLLISHTILATDQFNLFLKSSRLNAEYYDGTSYTKGTDFDLVSNRWYLALAKINKTTKAINLYLFNQEITTAGITGTLNTVITNKSLIGYNNVAGATNIFSGLMSYSEVRNYGTSLVDNKVLFKPVIKRDTVQLVTDGSVETGITATFATGNTYINHGDGTEQELMTTAVENLHTSTAGKNYEKEISNTSNLTVFNCDSSRIISINIPDDNILENVIIGNNELNSISLSLPIASFFRVENNNLTTLDFSNKTNLLQCTLYGNSISSIDISLVTNLSLLFCENNGMTSTTMDNITIDLDNNGEINGSLRYIVGNSARTAASDIAYNNLIAKGWTVT